MSEKWRVFDGLDVVQERDAGNVVTAQLVRDGNIGGILSRTRFVGGTAQGAVFYHYDGAGNVIQLTSGYGQSVGSYFYDAWGQTTLISQDAAAAENPYRFSTRQTGDTNLFYGLILPKKSRNWTWTTNAWVKTSEKWRLFDGLDVVQERDANNAVTAQLVRDGNIGGILSRSRQSAQRRERFLHLRL